MQEEFLTIAEVARELEMSRSGVYKLVKQGRIGAIRLSERGMRISRIALDGYRRRLQGDAGNEMRAAAHLGFKAVRSLRRDFETATGASPEVWKDDWRAGKLPDTPQNMERLIEALWLTLQERQDAPAGAQSSVQQARGSMPAYA